MRTKAKSKLRTKRPAQAVSKKKPARIGHVYHGKNQDLSEEDWEAIPRGWIHPEGKFFRTKHHWDTISAHLGSEGSDDPAEGERSAHQAYSEGWISIGHGGALNAVGHKSTFEAGGHPAVMTLRKLVSKVPHFTLRVERQIGRLDAKSGKHEDFDVREYDLDVFIRRGRLKKA